MRLEGRKRWGNICLILQRVVGRESKGCCWQGDGGSREKPERTKAILWGEGPWPGRQWGHISAGIIQTLPAAGAFETALRKAPGPQQESQQLCLILCSTGNLGCPEALGFWGFWLLIDLLSKLYSGYKPAWVVAFVALLFFLLFSRFLKFSCLV